MALKTCEYCGQVIDCEGYQMPEDLCGCAEASMMRQKKITIEKAEEKVDSFFAEPAADYGFEAVQPGILTMIRLAVRDVAEERARKVTYQLCGNEVAVVSGNLYGVNIERKKNTEN